MKITQMKLARPTVYFKSRKLKNDTLLHGKYSYLGPLAAGILFISSLTGFFLNNRSFGIFDDNEGFLGPWIAFASRESSLPFEQTPIFSGVLGGLELYSAPQLSTSYPFYFSWLAELNSWEEASVHLTLIVWFHLLVLLLGSFYLLRTLQISPVISSIMASFLLFSPNVWSHTGWFNVIAPISWIPWAIAFYLRFLQSPGYSRLALQNGSLTIAVMSLVITSSLSQPLIMTILMLGFIFMGQLFSATAVQKLPIVVRTLGIALITISLTLPIWAPIVSRYPDMLRWVGTAEPVKGFNDIPTSVYAAHQMAWLDLVRMLDLSGVATDSSFIFSPIIGLSIPLLGIIGAFQLKHSVSGTWVIPALSIYGLLSSLGTNTWVFWLNTNLPLVSQIREPQRFLLLFQIGIVILAAYGAQRIANDLGKDIISTRTKFVAGVVLLFICLDVSNLVKSLFVAEYFLILGALLVILGMLFWVAVTLRVEQKQVLTSLLAVSAFAAIAPLSLSMINGSFPKSYALSETYKTQGLFEVYNEINSRDPDNDFTLVIDSAMNQRQIKAMLATYNNISILSPYFNPLPQNQFEVMYDHGNKSPLEYEERGARFLLCEGECERPSTDWVPIFSKNSYILFENPKARSFMSLSSDKIGPSSFESCEYVETERRPTAVFIDYSCDFPPSFVINIFQDGYWRASSSESNPISLRTDEYSRPTIQLFENSGSATLTYVPEFSYMNLAPPVVISAGIITYLIGLKKKKRKKHERVI